MIIVLVVIPLLILTYFASNLISQEYQKNKLMNELGQLTNLAVKLSNLVHEQQKERGATAVFVSSGGKSFKAELTAQRQQTDKHRTELQNYLDLQASQNFGTEFTNLLKPLLAKLDQMPDIRNKVDGLSISKGDAVTYYTQLNGQNLNFIGFIGQLSQDADVTLAYVGYASFLQSKERAGLERAVGASGISDGKFSVASIDKFKRLITIQDTYNASFMAQATDQQTALFEAFMADDKILKVEAMRQLIIAGGLDGDFKGLTSKAWFDAITLKINKLKDIENTLSASLLADIEKLESNANEELWTMVFVSTLCLGGIICLSFIIISNINKAFNGLIKRMTSLANGDLEVDFPPIYNTEIGKMIESIVVFKNNAIEKVALEAKQQQDEKCAIIEKQNMMNKLADNFNQDVGGIVDAVSLASEKLQETAKSMTSISETTSNNADLVSNASETASENVQSVAAASEEMSQSITEINKQVLDASNASKTAVNEVDKTAEEMKNLASNVEKVGGVVSLIASIADQTNLLALNATIESSRAGEAGRGFAVVAAEVKELASKTALATGEITQHIADIETATKKALASMGGIGDATAKFEQISTSIAVAVEQQSYATLEISNNAQEAASGTELVSTNIAKVSQASKVADDASHDVMLSASDLLAQSDKLKSEVNKFTDEVRLTG